MATRRRCLQGDFTSRSVPDDSFLAIIEARLDDFIDFTSSRFFQTGPTRPEVTIAVAAEVGGLQPAPLLLRLWRLRVLILSYLLLFLVISCTKVISLTGCLAICKYEQQTAAEWSQSRVRKWEMAPTHNLICGMCLVHGRSGTVCSQIDAIPQIYATSFRMPDLQHRSPMSGTSLMKFYQKK
jgi:hypothetical protein